MTDRVISFCHRTKKKLRKFLHVAMAVETVYPLPKTVIADRVLIMSDSLEQGWNGLRGKSIMA